MKIKKAVIPVAGKGTRFLPATKSVPKELIPIINIPMIYYILEEVVRSGIHEVIFITSKGKESLAHFIQKDEVLTGFLEEKNKTELIAPFEEVLNKLTFTEVEQKEQLGLGHAVLQAEPYIEKGESFAVLLGDDLVISNNPVTKQLVEVCEKQEVKNVIGVMEVPRHDVSKYGIVQGQFLDKKTLKMETMVEKPEPEAAPTTLATPGRYILNSEIFDCLNNITLGAGGEYQLTDAINLLCTKEKVLAHIFEGDRFDTGNPKAYLEATVEFALRNENYRDDFVKTVKESFFRNGISL